MATFSKVLTTSLPAEVAWRRVLDLHGHSAVIPLTTVTGEALAADELRPGSRFVARTAFGPVGFDDPMVVDEITPPRAEAAGMARIRKEGRAIRGSIELRVVPTPEGSRVEWEQEIRVRGVPRAADAVTAAVSSAAYGMALRRLLARVPP